MDLVERESTGDLLLLLVLYISVRGCACACVRVRVRERVRVCVCVCVYLCILCSRLCCMRTAASIDVVSLCAHILFFFLSLFFLKGGHCNRFWSCIRGSCWPKHLWEVPRRAWAMRFRAAGHANRRK